MTQEWRQLINDEREGRAESPLVAQLAFSENPGHEPPLAIHAITSNRTGLNKDSAIASKIDVSLCLLFDRCRMFPGKRALNMTGSGDEAIAFGEAK